MKLMPIVAPPGSPDELIWLVDAFNRNIQDLEQLTRRGLRVPLGSPGLPSIGFQNPGFDGIGASGMQDNVTGVVQGIFVESNALRQRAASPATGAIAEVVPRDVPDAGGTPARISALETDVQADPENFSRVDLQAGSDMKIESYARGAAPLRNLVLGVDDAAFTEAVRIKKTEAVVNDPGIATMDFRVEGDTDPNMIFVDASVDRVGIGEGVPTSTLDVDGSLSLPTSTISTTVTADGTQYTLLVDATGASRTINLPAAATVPGRIYVIKKVDASVNTVVVDPAAAELIDGVATKSLSAQWDSLGIQSDGTSWFIVADKLAGSGGSGITAIRLENVDVVNPASIIDFDGRDFNVTVEAAGEGLVQILDKLDIHSWSTPTILAAGQNDYAFAGGNAAITGQRVSASVAVNVTGIAAQTGGFIYILRNIGTFNINLLNQSASSLAANRIITGTGTDASMRPDEMAMLIYDNVTSRWCVFAKSYTSSAAAVDLTQIEQDLGTVALRSGSFTLTDAALLAGELLIITQAGGPYTGKGTREDEAEMDGLTVMGTIAAGGGSALIYWNSATYVLGKFKFNYLHGS